MGRPTRRLARSTFLLLTAVTLVLGVPTAPAEAAGYRLDLARPGDFVRQYTNEQCIGASIQMMLNISGARNDRSAATQRRLWDLATTLSWVGGEGPNRTTHPDGATARGWLRALRHLGMGSYVLRTEATYQAALRTAARAISATKRPVGLLVWTGDHALVMAGFSATADPARTDAFEVTGARILDPLYPSTSRTWGPSPAPTALLASGRLGRFFVPWQGRFNRGWNDRYVLIVPTVMAPTPHSPRLR